jgi:trk system potassium uptake protein TrkH
MSGFTATGSTVLTDIKAQSRSILLWRQFTQWLGGMGIIILAIAILPKLAVGGRQLMEAELPGPQVEKLTPRIRETAKALWKIYIGLTLAEVILLVVVGLSFYDALAHAFTTPATGGFSTKARNIEALGSAAQWVIIPFMFLGGVNFALLYRALRQPKAFLKDSEFKFYLGLVLLASGLVLLNLRGYEIGDAIRHSIFQVISILATGYSSTNFEEWNTTAKTIMLVLMFFGASAGSTSGSIKLIRVLLIFKIIAQQVRKAIHPQAVIPLRVGERVVSEDIVKGIVVFAIFYVMVSAGGVVVLLLDVGRVGIELSTLEAASAVATTLGNIGPGFGLVGPMSSFAPLPQTSKVLLTFLMWLGRLEIFPIIALFTRSYWKG